MFMVISVPKNPFISKYLNGHTWFIDIADTWISTGAFLMNGLFGMDIVWTLQSGRHKNT